MDARDVAEILEIEPQFEQSARIRPRKMKRQFKYETEDDPVI